MLDYITSHLTRHALFCSTLFYSMSLCDSFPVSFIVTYSVLFCYSHSSFVLFHYSPFNPLFSVLIWWITVRSVLLLSAPILSLSLSLSFPFYSLLTVLFLGPMVFVWLFIFNYFVSLVFCQSHSALFSDAHLPFLLFYFSFLFSPLCYFFPS